jgi:hypothetical protein
MLNSEETNAHQEIADHERRVELQRLLVIRLSKHGRSQSATLAYDLLQKLLVALARLHRRARSQEMS